MTVKVPTGWADRGNWAYWVDPEGTDYPSIEVDVDGVEIGNYRLTLSEARKFKAAIAEACDLVVAYRLDARK